MPNCVSESIPPPDARPDATNWPTFERILYGLHAEGIWVTPQQLAMFYLYHGLPVDLRYVPPHLHARATRINDNYQGDMARLERVETVPWYSVGLG